MSKEKQIEEMAEVLRHSCENECFRNKDGFTDCEACEACLLYDAGYRKQREGEWLIPATGKTWNGNTFGLCSSCGKTDNGFIKKAHNFCPNCGAKMKGGAE